MSIAAPRDFRGVFRTDESARAVYSEAAGIGRSVPRAIAVPRDADDVSHLVRWARDTRRPLVPRGSGSSMAGGAVGSGESVVMDLSRLRELADPDVARHTIAADAGVIRGEVARRVAGAGLRFPVDPSSGEFCTIAGMAATNAAGAHSLLHGPMRPWVRAIECVFDDGTRAEIRRGEAAPTHVPAVARFMDNVSARLLSGAPERPKVLKNSSGYAVAAYQQTRELVDLLVGSEGTLAVFTRVELALIPEAGGSASLFVSFASLEAAVEAAVAARTRGVAACELLDRTFLQIAAKSENALPIAPGAEAALLVEVEADDAADAAAKARGLHDLFHSLEATESIVAVTPGHEAELWSFRHAASPALARLDPALKSMQFIEDAAVPPTALADYVRGVREILARAGIAGVIFGHAGDAHVHVNPLVDVRLPDWRDRVERILLQTTELVARLGGTTSGEHGDGRLRTPLMNQVWTEAALADFGAIKRAFDPRGILNPGVKVPLANQRAIDAVKYDPSADALPADARRALDIVERERAYGRFRLELL